MLQHSHHHRIKHSTSFQQRHLETNTMFLRNILVTIAVLSAVPLSFANPVAQDNSITPVASNVPAASAIAPLDASINADNADDVEDALEAAEAGFDKGPTKLRYRQEDLVELAADDDESEVEDAGADVLNILEKRADCRVETKRGVRGDCHPSQCKPSEQCKLNVRTGRCVWKKKSKKQRPYACTQCKCARQR
jgi:hypothetical protein